jgi:hypothetical protein
MKHKLGHPVWPRVVYDGCEQVSCSSEASIVQTQDSAEHYSPVFSQSQGYEEHISLERKCSEESNHCRVLVYLVTRRRTLRSIRPWLRISELQQTNKRNTA